MKRGNDYMVGKIVLPGLTDEEYRQIMSKANGQKPKLTLKGFRKVDGVYKDTGNG